MPLLRLSWTIEPLYAGSAVKAGPLRPIMPGNPKKFQKALDKSKNWLYNKLTLKML